MTNPVHEITTDEAGHWHGTDGHTTVTLIGAGRMFKRRAVKGVGSDESVETCWLVAELDGVRVYHQGNHIIVTKEELYP
jgi:hypothetical protein